MHKKLITSLAAITVVLTAVIAGVLLFNQQDPTLDDVPFVPASDAYTEPVVAVNTNRVLENTNVTEESTQQPINQNEVQQDTSETSPTTTAVTNTNLSVNSSAQVDLGQTITVTISGPSIAKRCVVDVAEPMSVHQVMKHASQQCHFSYVGKSYSGMGFFVEELAGKLSDTKSGKYWIYYVNGTKASVGVSSLTVRAGDVVTWQFENEIK